MLFPTIDYAFFFAVAFVGAWSVRRSIRAHQVLLLALSYVFYAFWDWHFVPLLLSVSLVGAGIAGAIQQESRPRARSWLLALGITLCLSALVFFKYLAFLTGAALSLLGALGVDIGASRLPEIALPVGLSFFVFHAISLMVDAWRGELPGRLRVVEALLYVAFFPQLVAGPITKASTFMAQLAQPRDETDIDVPVALELILRGLVKKVLIAQTLAAGLVDPVFEAPTAQSGLTVLLGVYAYALQIYCDFSGYTDLALGSARLLGYRLPDNFDAPYLASGPQDFWRRWHMSLSNWLRDYLFIPLGGSRGTASRTALNLLITMVLGGLWHGAAWTFVAWGAFHGVGLMIERGWSELRWQPVQALRQSRGWAIARVALTFHFVCAGWVLFRSPSLAAAAEVFEALAAPAGQLSVAAAVFVALGAAIVDHLLPAAARGSARAWVARLPLPVQGALAALVVLAVDALGPRGLSPFIYFRF